MRHANKWLAFVALCVAAGLPQAAPVFDREDDEVIARSLTAMLRAARTVVSRNQALINDPTLGDKGLTGKKVLADALIVYKETTQVDPKTIIGGTKHGRLFKAQQDAVVEVIDANQDTINQKGVAFKGFIPSTFGRLLNEAFARRVSDVAVARVAAGELVVRSIFERRAELAASLSTLELAAADGEARAAGLTRRRKVWASGRR
jgi:hypothetical protein